MDEETELHGSLYVLCVHVCMHVSTTTTVCGSSVEGSVVPVSDSSLLYRVPMSQNHHDLASPQELPRQMPTGTVRHDAISHPPLNYSNVLYLS